MHNTGNPLGSKDILDLYDNSETIDNFVNSQQDEVPDRFGTKRLTLAGLIKRSMALRNEINDFSGALTLKPEWSDVPMNVSEGVGGDGGALNLQAEALGNRLEKLAKQGCEIIDFSFTSNFTRKLDEKLKDIVSIKDFDGKGDAVTDDTVAALNMLESEGYLLFSRGGYHLNTVTLDGPVIFDYGAYITVPAGQTVTITGRIESTRQWVFRGEGQVLLRNDANSGEDSRNIHASWFGVFPVNDAMTDMQPRLSKLLQSLDNSREAVVSFDIGRYPLHAASVVPRATELRGMGSRRTIFEVNSSGYDVFTAQANGVRFSGMQFELSDTFPTSYRTSGYYINSGQQLVELDDVWVSKAVQNILLSGGRSTAKNIRATFDKVTPMPAGSSVITLEGSDIAVNDVMVVSDGEGPECVVSIGGVGLNNISGIDVSKVRNNSRSIPVLVTAKSKILSAINVTDVACRGMDGFEVPGVVELITSGSGTIDAVVLDGLVANSETVDFIRMTHNSTGVFTRVSVSNAKGIGGDGVGLKINRIAGSMSKITVDQTVDVSGYSTPIQRTGVMTDVMVSPVAVPNTNFPISYDATIADDSVYSIDMSASAFTGMVLVSIGFTEYVIAVARAVPTAQITSMLKSTNADVSTTILTGTTGVDGKFTVSATPGKLYLENRLGSSQRVSVSLLYGVK